MFLFEEGNLKVLLTRGSSGVESTERYENRRNCQKGKGVE